MNAHQFQNAIRILYCMGAKEFRDCFGPDKAPHLWEKYTVEFHRNPAELVCYLDHKNIRALHDYLQITNEKQGIGADADIKISGLYDKLAEVVRRQTQ